MMNNPLIPAHGKGVLVALRPVPGIALSKALTLCRPNRTGDIMTIGGNRLVLFLSFCRINDLDTALNHIFPLPTGIFSNRWSGLKMIKSVPSWCRCACLPRTMGHAAAFSAKF